MKVIAMIAVWIGKRLSGLTKLCLLLIGLILASPFLVIGFVPRFILVSVLAGWRGMDKWLKDAKG